ncbi:MAG: sigma-70 family RNA polymerase sigma factor [Pseudonocardiaceae bacterium]|nr:sigma-70 family RNA polymerase sigma factor [Pseudonocardiaceae bacterium]
MREQPRARPDPALGLLDIYDSALPQVHGYLLARCRDRALAQDLTAETFLAAVTAARKQPTPPITTGWLIGVARHKLADHWRWAEREQRGLRLAHATGGETEDPWDVEIDTVVAHQVLDALGPHHRAALTLRYLDGLPVAQVAGHLGRTVHATEALLVRARAAFRAAYEDPEALR